MKRWTCTNCNTGVLAPERPRRDDPRRYCEPCSRATGRVVERTCPSLDRRRADRKAAASARRSRAVAAMRAHPQHGGIDLLAEAAEIWKHMTEFHCGAALPAIKVRFTKEDRIGVSGRAWGYQQRLVVTVRARSETWLVVEVLAHELAHCATPGHGHNEVWADCFVKAARARYCAEHFSGVRAASGYAVDRYVRPAIERYWRACDPSAA